MNETEEADKVVGHTPGEVTAFESGSSWFIKSANSRLIAGCYSPDHSPLWAREQEANAKHLETCWNLHDSLLADRDEVRNKLSGIANAIALGLSSYAMPKSMRPIFEKIQEELIALSR